MFTGLIEKLGEVVELERGDGGGVLRVRTDPWPDLEQGESIGIQGVCLTLTQQDGPVLRFDLLEETLNRTNLGNRGPGALLNLERALRYGDTMGGHIVNGHVDGVGTLKAIHDVQGGDRVLRIACPAELISQVVSKGSIAVDGVSLTIVDVDADGFTVHIIPHTWSHTSFQSLQAGDKINLEADVLAKYARSILHSEEGADAELSWDTLARLGQGSAD